MPPAAAAPLTETFGTLSLPLGGRQGYKGVRGGQGPKRDGFQGYTPRKTHCTKVYKTAHEAAVQLALLKRDRENNSEEGEERKPRKTRCDKVILSPSMARTLDLPHARVDAFLSALVGRWHDCWTHWYTASPCRRARRQSSRCLCVLWQRLRRTFARRTRACRSRRSSCRSWRCACECICT